MNENDQKNYFESEGYLIVEQLLSEDEVRSCQNEIQTLHQKAKGYFETGISGLAIFSSSLIWIQKKQTNRNQMIIQCCEKLSVQDVFRLFFLIWQGTRS